MRTASRRHGTTTFLRAPTVIFRTVVPAGINATSNVSGAVYDLMPPTPFQTKIQTSFALRRRVGRSRLEPPNAITIGSAPPAPVVSTIRVKSVAVTTRPDQRRRQVQWKLSAPTVITIPSVAPTADQLKIRTRIPQQPRRLPARITFISPAIVNPIVLSTSQVTTKVRLASIQTAQTRRLRGARSRYTRPGFTGGLLGVGGTINATSAVAGTVTNIVPITPSVFSSTSTISASFIRLVAIRGASINSLSGITALVSNPNTPATDNPVVQSGWISYYH